MLVTKYKEKKKQVKERGEEIKVNEQRRQHGDYKGQGKEKRGKKGMERVRR